MVKNPPAHAGDGRDAGLIPGSGRSPGGGHGYPLQYSCLENPMGLKPVAIHGNMLNRTVISLKSSFLQVVLHTLYMDDTCRSMKI